MNNPSSYPKTDTAEVEAVSVLHLKIDPDRIKADIKVRDKYPNVDGTLEIVSNDRVPMGKFDVQVKKIPKDCNRYSCPVELYNYSMVSSLPVLLIVVDVDSYKAYWRHIYNGMAEYKKDQDSFTIIFGSESIIERGGIYLNQWIPIVQDYNTRIANFPNMARMMGDMIDLNSIDKSDLAYLQRYTEELNGLINGELQCIKTAVLPHHCRLGVGIIQAEKDSLTYRHHLLEFGSTTPTVFNERPKDITDGNAVSICYSRRDFLKEPRAKALDYLSHAIQSAIRDYKLVVHGEDVASNVISYFIENFSFSFNLHGPGPYKLDDVVKSLNESLPLSCQKHLPIEENHVGRIDLHQMEYFLSSGRAVNEGPVHKKGNYIIEHNKFPIKILADSIRCLQNSGVKTVLNPWPNIGQIHGPWIWSYKDKGKVRENIRLLYQRLLFNYNKFVSGNQFKITNSPYLDQNVIGVREFDEIISHKFV